MKTKKFWTVIAGMSGFIAVALGAFGAHVLKKELSAEWFAIFEKGVFYQMIHSVVILTLAIYDAKRFFLSAFFFILGIILFSFSLYIYSLTGIRVFALITPVGGVSFLISWGLLIIYALKNNFAVK
jgi:uncharacterized membrane protein YgdD (TMEM256/DUF423 family)